MFEPQNLNILRRLFGSRSQSIGRGRISWEGAFDVRECRERRDKKNRRKIKKKKNAKILDQKQQFSMRNFNCFGRGKTIVFFGGGCNFKTG